MGWISDIGSAITGIFSSLGNGILEFLTSGFTLLFLEVSEAGAVTGVSNFGIFMFVLLGISIVMGLTYFLVNVIRKRR